MNIINRIKNQFNNDNYFIGISTNEIYVLNYSEIKSSSDERITVLFNDFSLVIIGYSLSIIRKNDREISIVGNLTKLEKVNE